MQKETQNWLNMVDYDLETARHMLRSGRFVYVIFMCHLAIEKCLKAIAVESTGRIPPKTHDLIHLINLSSLKLPADLLDFVGIINNAGIVTRYPEDLTRLVSSYPKDAAENYLAKTEEVINCLKKDSRLKNQ